MEDKSMLRGPLFILSILMTIFFIQGCDDSHHHKSKDQPPPVVGSVYEGPETHSNASAAFWQEKLWLFYPTEDPNDEIHYKTFDGDALSDGKALKIGDNVQNTLTQMTPIVVDKILYLFFTGTGGKLDYTYFNPISETWKGLYRVGDGTTDPNKRYAAVYNTLHRWIEVYWVPEGSDKIHYAYLHVDADGLPSGSWQGFGTIYNYNYPSAEQNLSAVFYQTGEESALTYLAFRYNKMGHVHHIQFQETGSNQYTPYIMKTDRGWPLEHTGDGPSLADLGQEKMAMIWKTCDGCDVHYQKYDKDLDRWLEESVLDVSTNNWLVNGVVYYDKAQDSRSAIGYRWDAIFFIIYGHWKNDLHLNSWWKAISAETEGCWMGIDEKESDLAEFEQETFHLWPLIALIDAPPFVLNGIEPPDCTLYTCTSIALGVEKSQTTTWSGELKVGPYVETGKKSPVTMELSVGVSASYDESITYKVDSTDTLYQSTEGLMMGFYLAPRFKTYTLEWYEEGTTPTGTYIYPMSITGYSIEKYTFNPEEGPCPGCDNMPYPYIARVPSHAEETDDMARLNSYVYDDDANPENYEGLFDPIVKTWTTGSPADITWSVSSEKSQSIGSYIEFKIGVEYAHIIGAGVEGSIEAKMTTTNESGAKVQMVLENHENIPTQSGDVTRFDVTGYWLKPDKDGYWIPENRKGMGDAPSFFTYSVRNSAQKP